MPQQSRILIVEDELIVANDLKDCLERLGYAVTGIFPTGEEAVEQAGRERPDLVLMDIGLQGVMDGVAAAGMMRRDHGLPVVYFTGYTEKTIRELTGSAEPLCFLRKPFEERELHLILELALCRHGEEQAFDEGDGRFGSLLRNPSNGARTGREGGEPS